MTSHDQRGDEELVAACNAGGPTEAALAFEALYRRHRDYVLRIARRFARDRDLALDALQETFAYLLTKFPPAGGGLEEVTITGSRIQRARRAESGRAARMGTPSPFVPAAGNQGLVLDGSAGRARGADASAAQRAGLHAPLSRVQPGEEIWVIATAGDANRATGTGADRDDSEPGSGAMLALLAPVPDSEPQQIPLPLKHTDVRAVVTGYVGTVDVTQQFENPYDEKIEAVYLFPLPEKAAVSEFVMTIGERKIRGILREKEEAEQIYRDARSQGYQASLLTQHRPNIFEQKVANIEPGKRIDVTFATSTRSRTRTAGIRSCSRRSSGRATTRRAPPTQSPLCRVTT